MLDFGKEYLGEFDLFIGWVLWGDGLCTQSKVQVMKWVYIMYDTHTAEFRDGGWERLCNMPGLPAYNGESAAYSLKWVVKYWEDQGQDELTKQQERGELKDC